MRLRSWWRTWAEVIGRLIALFGSVGSLAGVFYSFVPPVYSWPPWALPIVALGAGGVLGLAYLICVDHRRHRVYAREDGPGVRRYLHGWIKHGGRVAIWTRDMSWAEHTDIRQTLRAKAKRGELILCLPELCDLAVELRAAGAEVCDYGKGLLETPASRFTIAHYGRDGAQVSVGRAYGENHVIEEFSSGTHAAFCLAQDLVDVARAWCASGRSE